MSELQSLTEWQALETQAKSIKSLHIRDLIKLEENREQSMWGSCGSVTLDYSKQLLTTKTLQLLLALAEKKQLSQKIHALFCGEAINTTEKRAALHMALRYQPGSTLPYPKSIVDEVDKAREATSTIASLIRCQKWRGASGKLITDIVNIGIGGSDLGPTMTLSALKEFTDKKLGYHFISDGDPLTFDDVIENLNPETTLFIVTSKSFTTKETLFNFQKAKNWVNHKHAIAEQFIAVTSKTDKAHKMGFKHVLPIWDWVGGRYSVFSAVNLISQIALGDTHFEQFKQGAALVDEHFFHSPFNINLPVIMAMLGIWSINFLNKHSLAVLCYSKRLKEFVPYIQQLNMESNANRVNIDNEIVDYATGPIVWGGLGNRAQHAYYQLLCQGTQRVPCDFILLEDNHTFNHFAYNKIEALSHGTLKATSLNDELPGNTPLNTLRLKSLTPQSFGELIALYEHKIFCQSVIWSINPFDQPGVDSTKRLHKQGTTLSSPELLTINDLNI